VRRYNARQAGNSLAGIVQPRIGPAAPELDSQADRDEALASASIEICSSREISVQVLRPSLSSGRLDPRLPSVKAIGRRARVIASLDAE